MMFVDALAVVVFGIREEENEDEDDDEEDEEANGRSEAA